MNPLIATLQERGLLDTVSHEELHAQLCKPTKVYLGFDPTADSLHLGNLVGIIVLKWFAEYGHIPVVLLGGATARIGDPSGKSKERPLLDDAQLEINKKGIKKLFDRFFDFSSSDKALFVDNNDWLSKFSLINFLRDVGKHFRLSTMLAKESVKARLESEDGMSFTEFTYQMLQGYDFYHLYEKHGVVLQLGGSDQWGNITAGIEFVRKQTHHSVFGFTFPLLTRSDGKKFGKSEQGAIWLDPSKCSYYQFYQYFISIPDEDIIKMLKILTFLPMEEIHKIERSMKEPSYKPNEAQRILASEITRWVHGEEGLNIALETTSSLRPGADIELTADNIEALKSVFPTLPLRQEEVIGELYASLVLKSGLVSSKSEAFRLIENHGAYLNNEKIADTKKIMQQSDLIEDRYLVISSGKKKKVLIEVVNS